MLNSNTGYAQKDKSASQPDISQNRIEYRKLSWQVFHTPAYHIYFPKGADSIPAFLTKEILPAKALLQKRMGGTANLPQAIIVYPSLAAQYESSIGAAATVPLTVPTFVARGSRIVLHYEGSYTDLKTQLYLALARANWEKELESASLNAQVKGAVKSEPIPYWFKEGAIRYFAGGWPVNAEADLREVFITDSPASFYALQARHPALTGSALCYYLSTARREDLPLQLYYQLRRGKSLEKALRLVCKEPADKIYEACFHWYRQRFSDGYTSGQGNSNPQQGNTAIRQGSNPGVPEEQLGNEERQDNTSLKIPLPYKQGKGGTILSYELDPSRKYLALLVSFPDHRRSVYTCELSTAKTYLACSYRLPPWMKSHEPDRYPLLYWNSPDELLVTYPWKGKLQVQSLTPQGRQRARLSIPFIDGLDKLIPMGENRYLLSAWLQGQSDLVIYDANKDKFSPLTTDAADEAAPALSPHAATQKARLEDLNATPIYFTSTRRGDTAYGQDSAALYHGIYALLNGNVTPVLTDTLAYNQFEAPLSLEDGRLFLTATRNGKRQKVFFRLGPSGLEKKQGEKMHQQSGDPGAQLQLLTDGPATWAVNELPVQLNARDNTVSFFSLIKPLPQAGKRHKRLLRDTVLIQTISIDKRLEQSGNDPFNRQQAGPWLVDYEARKAARQKEDSILKAAKEAGGTSFLEGVFRAATDKDKKPEQKDSTAFQYKPAKARPYVLQLYSAYFSAQVNNDYFINRYQPYGTFQGSFKFPDVGGMVQGGLSDLFEHHHLSVAYRLPAGSEGSMFFTRYTNSARRLDWSLAYYRDVESLHPDPLRAWTDENGRPYPNAAKVKTHYYELTLSYPLSYYSELGGSVFLRTDRTVFLATDKYSLFFPAMTDIWAGVPVWLERKYLRPTLPGLYTGWKANIRAQAFKSFSGSESFTGAAEVSAQWHKPLYKYITLVLKGQAAYSGGDKKILYNLGGVDNNLTPRVDSTVHFIQSAPYAFQTLVTPFRGYFQNSLYGSSYGMLNADVYFPLFESLIPLETPFPSLNHLQLGIFSDVAKADGEGAYTTTDKGWLLSYGLSARTTLAGYPLRFDIAWPKDGSRQVWYLSLNL